MPYPATPEDEAAIERLGTGHYNNDPVSPANPGGFDNGGYVTNLHAANGDVARAAIFVGDAAEFVDGRANVARDKAAEAAGYVGKMSGTSATQVAIGEGAKAFATQAGKFFEPGRDIKIVSAANPSTHWMSGVATAYANGTLTVDVTDFEGAGARADWILFSTSRPGAAGTIEIAGVTSGAPDSAPSVIDEGSESAAVLRITIPRGRPAGLPYTWSANNAASDPGPGRIKVSSASLTAATEIYISETDRDGVAVAAEIASWDDSSSTVRGRLRLQDLGNAANFAVYDVVGAIVDNGGWDTLRVVHVDHGGTIADGAKLVAQFRATGDRGEAGPSAYAVAVANGYPGTAEQWLASLVGNPGQPGQPGGQGPVGNPPAIVFNFDTGTNDADPGNGRVRFNNATFGNVTAILFDNLDAFSNTVANWLDTLDDSTNVGNKGELTFVQVDNGARFAKFRVTGPVVDATGFRRVPVVHVDSAGALTGRVGVAFSPAGNQGTNGDGAGNVVGPAEAGVGRVAVFTSADGKTIGEGPDVPTTPEDIGAASAASLAEHVGRTDNPHEVTKAQVGLANVDNTSDANKPVSTATATALASKADLSGGKLREDQLPALAITDTFVVASQAAMLALTAQRGDIAVRSDLNKTFALAAEPATTLANWIELRTPTDAVLSVAGKTGAVQLVTADISGLATTLAAKADLVSGKVPASQLPAIGAAKIEIFDASGTWTKDPAAVRVDVLVQGAGAGGASGERRASGTVSKGGNPGGPGRQEVASFRASDLPSSVSVTVGVAGNGGPSVTTDSSGVNAGSQGGTSRFSQVEAQGGVQGVSSNPSASRPYRRLAGDIGLGASTGGGPGAGVGADFLQPGAGAPGAGQQTTPATFNGGVRYIAGYGNFNIGKGATKEDPGPAMTFTIDFGLSNQGGGGGWVNADGTAGKGGDGAIGAGGGGGGGSLNGNPSGEGGKGGNGRVVVISYF